MTECCVCLSGLNMARFRFREPPLRRYAFLLGNAAYDHIPRLHNPTNDIAAVAAELRWLRYEVHDYSNLDWRNTWLRLDDFFKVAGDCDAMVLYYCGHGLQIAGKNYIVPTDFDPTHPVDVEADAETEKLAGLVCVQDVIGGMSRADSRVIFLDACRDSGGFKEIRVRPSPEAAPARQVTAAGSTATRGLKSGIAKQKLKDFPQTFICYAADPDDVAADGPDGGMSPFSYCVSQNVGIRGLDIFNMSQRVARQVREKTNGRQTPWSNANLTKDFEFYPTSNRPIWIMGALGALAGLVGALVSFDSDTLKLHDVSKEGNHWRLLTSLALGLVLGIGAYIWGKRRWYAAVGTCLIYAGVAAFCRYWFADNLKTTQMTTALYNKLYETPAPVSWDDIMSNVAVLLYALLASALAGAASIFSAAPFVHDMTRLGSISIGLVIGAFATGLFLLFLSFRDHVPDFLVVTVLFMLWEALLAANAGWSYADPSEDYVPSRSWRAVLKKWRAWRDRYSKSSRKPE